MKKTLLIFTVFVITVATYAQGIDFSGSWKLNNSKSKLGEQFSMAPKEIIVIQKGNDLKIEKHSSFQDQDFITTDTLTLDGKECTNKGFRDTEKKSTAVWSDDKASLKITTKFTIGDGGEMIIVEIYKMDGANMIIESNATSSYGEMAETMAFDKQ